MTNSASPDEPWRAFAGQYPPKSEAKAKPLEPRSALERRIAADRRWRRGIEWGAPRPGHPEGAVRFHVEAVLGNVDEIAIDERDLLRLRFIALVHDTFKHEVDINQPRRGENDHAMIARRFAEGYTDEQEVLLVIETHDDAYRAWRRSGRDSGRGEREADALIRRLGSAIEFYGRFHRADTLVEGKDATHVRWFEDLVAAH